MATEQLPFTPELAAYYRGISCREHAILKKLREETAPMETAGMQISPALGQFFRLLAEMQGFRKIVELGVFTGYSSLNLALGLPTGGKIVGCDVSEEWTNIARRYWKEAGVEDKIELRLGPALDTLQDLKKAGAGTYDFVFIDADKENYLHYYEAVLPLLRTGGLMALDNVFRGGQVAVESNHEKDIEVMRELNSRIQNDDRVTHSVLPFGDGLTLLRKK